MKDLYLIGALVVMTAAVIFVLNAVVPRLKENPVIALYAVATILIAYSFLGMLLARMARSA